MLGGDGGVGGALKGNGKAADAERWFLPLGGVECEDCVADGCFTDDGVDDLVRVWAAAVVVGVVDVQMYVVAFALCVDCFGAAAVAILFGVDVVVVAVAVGWATAATAAVETIAVVAVVVAVVVRAVV